MAVLEKAQSGLGKEREGQGVVNFIGEDETVAFGDAAQFGALPVEFGFEQIRGPAARRLFAVENPGLQIEVDRHRRRAVFAAQKAGGFLGDIAVTLAAEAR